MYVDTNYGVKCPLKSGIYEKINSKHNSHYVTNKNEYSLPSIVDVEATPAQQQHQSNEPCKYLTQTQTLQVGCLNDQQYSLRTRLCYPNNAPTTVDTMTTSKFNSNNDRRDYQQTAYTQLESEINLVCLAHWRHYNGDQVIVSRTMSNEILCSVRFFH